MKTGNILVAHPSDEQIDVIKAFFKALKVKFEVKKEDASEDKSIKKGVTENIKRGFEEMKLIKEEKLNSTSLKDFLDEL